MMNHLFANKRSTNLKISQFLAASIAVITLLTNINSNAYNIRQTSSYQLDCVFLECERNTFDKLTTRLTDSNGTTEECSGCRHCTSAGYSVCMRLRESALRSRRAPDETIGNCGCAHTIPQTCDSKPIRQKPRNDSTKLFNVCYHSALQLPPKPQAENRPLSVLLTIEPFWLQSYWRGALTLSNLTMHYEFPVRFAQNCDGEVIKKESDNHFDLMCNANLTIEMGDDIIISEEGSEESTLDDDNSAEVDAEETIAEDDDDDYYEDDGFSEVQFDRAVFAGAKYVKVWYTVDVKRPRQLNNARRSINDVAIIDLESSLSSEILEFDLETDRYGLGDAEDADDGREIDIAGDSGDEFDSDDYAINEKEKEHRGNAIMDQTDEDQDTLSNPPNYGDHHEHETAPEQKLHTEKSAAEIAREIDFFADDSVDPLMNNNEDDDADDDESVENEDEERNQEISESNKSNSTEIASDDQVRSDTMKVSDEDNDATEQHALVNDASKSVDQNLNNIPNSTHEIVIENNELVEDASTEEDNNDYADDQHDNNDYADDDNNDNDTDNDEYDTQSYKVTTTAETIPESDENEKTNAATGTLVRNEYGIGAENMAADIEEDSGKEAEDGLEEIKEREEMELVDLIADSDKEDSDNDDEVRRQSNELNQEEEREQTVQHSSEVTELDGEEEMNTDSQEIFNEHLSQDEDQSSNELTVSVSDSVDHFQQDTASDNPRELISATSDTDRYSDDSKQPSERHQASSVSPSSLLPSPTTGEVYGSMEREDDERERFSSEEIEESRANLQQKITSTGKSFVSGEESVTSSTLNESNRVNETNSAINKVFHKFGAKRLSFVIYILGFLILACILLLCVLCVIRKRKVLYRNCCCSNSANDKILTRTPISSSLSSSSNGQQQMQPQQHRYKVITHRNNGNALINNGHSTFSSYKYTQANQQPQQQQQQQQFSIRDDEREHLYQ